MKLTEGNSQPATSVAIANVVREGSRDTVIRQVVHLCEAAAPLWLSFLAAALIGLAFSSPSTAFAQATTPSAIDYSMYFLADVRDNEHCAMTVSSDGKWQIDPRISNPAMTCPDMTSWRLFATVIHDRFWSDWADEEQNWPTQPWPLCSAQPAANCCIPHSSKNDPQHCPVFPGDADGSQATSLKAVAPPRRVGRPTLTQHLQALNTAADLDKAVAGLKASRMLAVQAPQAPECSDSVVEGLVPKTYESIGRAIRQTNSEITIRNRAFHDYLFENNLYNTNGIAAVFAANDENQRKNAPYAVDSRSAGQGQLAKLGKIDFPPNSIMIKSNWLYEPIAKKLGIENTPDKPFITQKMTTVVQYGQGSKAVNCTLTGIHYLMSFHVSSKDVPNWAWTTFEHIAVPGRCDFIGCNDSYGYRSTDHLPAGVARNYVAPHVKSDNLAMSSSVVFDRDKPYPAEEINSGLEQVFVNLGIGTAPNADKGQPSSADLGWRSYRLKGSQVEFTDSMGRSTMLGNSITEAGFMNNVSCITCHSRAGIHLERGKANFFRLSVFIKDLSDYGYSLSSHGNPNPSWFHNDDNAGTLDVLQADFVWGFFNANPIVLTAVH